MSATPKIRTDFWMKPIPPRQFDWSATYDDYDGAEDSGNRGQIGYGRTEAEAIADLRENYPRKSEADRMIEAMWALRDQFRAKGLRLTSVEYRGVNDDEFHKSIDNGQR